MLGGTTGALVRGWLVLAVVGVLLVAAVAAALRTFQPPPIADDGLESARSAIDRMVEPSQEVIREDIAAYLGRGGQPPVGDVDIVLTGQAAGQGWRLLAFRTRDTVCSVLVNGTREHVEHGCVAPNFFHSGQFIPHHTEGVYAGLVHESVVSVRAVLGSGAKVEADTVASPDAPEVRSFAVQIPGGAEAETFEVLGANGRVIDSFGNPLRP